MAESIPQLAAHKGLRGEVLLALKREQPLGAKQIAERLGVTTNAIRHHLKELEIETLISHEREQHGVGAPTNTYRLSAAGEAIFPKRYEETLTRLLEHVVRREGRQAAVAVVQEQYEDIKRSLGREATEGSATDRVTALAEAFTDAGYMTAVEQDGADYRLTLHNCVIHSVAERLPEVCDAELKFLESVLGARVDRRTHMVQGCNTCVYAINFSDDDGCTAADRGAPSEELT